MASDNKCPTLIKCYRGREETIIPEDGVPFLTGTKVLCWRPEALPTGISDSEGKRTEVAQGTHGEALLLLKFSFQLRFPECALQKYIN